MDIGSILLLLALVVLVTAYVASPLRTEQKRRTPNAESIELSELLAERERVLDALAELDFDNDMGKIPDELYPVQREALVKRGAAVLKLLDERIPGGQAVSEVPEAVAAVVPDDPVEALINARKIVKSSGNAKNNTNIKFCPNCGSRLQIGDKFCVSCGEKV
jgi:hypothetical protein